MLGADATAGMVVMAVLAAMGSGWAFRVLLLRTLRTRHPDEFAALGSPSRRQLTSLLPRHENQQINVWKYLWGGAAFRVKDPLVSAIALGALASDLVLAGGVAVLLWAARA